PYECEGAAGHEGEHHALKGAVTWESEPDLASRITELEELAADQVDALEKHSRAIADLRTHMSGAQAAIRGLGKQASLHTTTETDLEPQPPRGAPLLTGRGTSSPRRRTKCRRSSLTPRPAPLSLKLWRLTLTVSTKTATPH